MFAIPDLRGKPGYRNMTNFNHYMLQPLREGCSLIVIDESNTQPPLVNQIHKPPLVNQIHKNQTYVECMPRVPSCPLSLFHRFMTTSQQWRIHHCA